jgi:hypothetical protein
MKPFLYLVCVCAKNSGYGLFAAFGWRFGITIINAYISLNLNLAEEIIGKFQSIPVFCLFKAQDYF